MRYNVHLLMCRVLRATTPTLEIPISACETSGVIARSTTLTHLQSLCSSQNCVYIHNVCVDFIVVPAVACVAFYVQFCVYSVCVFYT